MKLDSHAVVEKLLKEAIFKRISFMMTSKRMAVATVHGRLGVYIVNCKPLEYENAEKRAPELDQYFKKLRSILFDIYAATNTWPCKVVIQEGNASNPPGWFLTFCSNQYIEVIITHLNSFEINADEKIEIGDILGQFP